VRIHRKLLVYVGVLVAFVGTLAIAQGGAPRKGARFFLRWTMSGVRTARSRTQLGIACPISRYMNPGPIWNRGFSSSARVHTDTWWAVSDEFRFNS